MDKNSERLDLFGLPVRTGHGKRGRPTFEVTPEKSNKIKLGLALGWTNERLAKALACSLATLKRHFRAELAERDMARDQLELERFNLVMKEAVKGNIGAIKEAGRMLERNDAILADERIRNAQARGQGQAKPKEPERPARPLGKKEAAQVAAQEVGGEGSLWQDDLTPGFNRPN